MDIVKCSNCGIAGCDLCIVGGMCEACLEESYDLEDEDDIDWDDPFDGWDDDDVEEDDE
jgi:hypothetical protein